MATPLSSVISGLIYQLSSEWRLLPLLLAVLWGEAKQRSHIYAQVLFTKNLILRMPTKLTTVDTFFSVTCWLIINLTSIRSFIPSPFVAFGECLKTCKHNIAPQAQKRRTEKRWYGGAKIMLASSKLFSQKIISRK